MGLKAEISNKQIVKTGKFLCQKLVLRGCKILGNRFPTESLPLALNLDLVCPHTPMPNGPCLLIMMMDFGFIIKIQGDPCYRFGLFKNFHNCSTEATRLLNNYVDV